jgi:phosphate/sulfate permease
MEENKSNAGQGLGIAGLVLGIIAILICFIPCVGILAIVPGIIGVTLSAIAYNQAVKGNGARGIIIAALVISILGSSVALMQGLGFSYLKNRPDKFWNNLGTKIEEEANKHIDDNFDEAGKEMEKILEQLENVDDSIHVDIKIGKQLSDEEFQKLLTDYEKLIKQTSGLAEKSKKGEHDATISYSKLALKLAAIRAKLMAGLPNLTEEQKQKLEEINKKYKKDLDNLNN